MGGGVVICGAAFRVRGSVLSRDLSCLGGRCVPGTIRDNFLRQPYLQHIVRTRRKRNVDFSIRFRIGGISALGF